MPPQVLSLLLTIHYQNPNIVTGALPIWEDKVLLCKRGISPRKGYWNVPGGYMENGETVEDGAIREVYEETLSKIVLTRLHMVYSIPRINQVYMHFLADLQALDFQITPESSEIKLFTEAELKKVIIPLKEALQNSDYSITINDKIDDEFKRVLMQFQIENGLPIGQFDRETVG